MAGETAKQSCILGYARHLIEKGERERWRRKMFPTRAERIIDRFEAEKSYLAARNILRVGLHTLSEGASA